MKLVTSQLGAKLLDRELQNSMMMVYGPRKCLVVLTLVIREGDPAVGTSGGVLFDGSNETLFDTAGLWTYDAVLRGAGVNENNARGIWWFDDAGLQLVVPGGHLAPGTAGSFMPESEVNE